MKIHGGGLVEIRFDCHTPGVDQEPVMVDISVDDERVDRLVFEGIGGWSWYYWLEKGEGVVSGEQGGELRDGKNGMIGMGGRLDGKKRKDGCMRFWLKYRGLGTLRSWGLVGMCGIWGWRLVSRNFWMSCLWMGLGFMGGKVSRGGGWCDFDGLGSGRVWE